MIDRPARNRMAELIRHYGAGRISNTDLDNAVEERSFADGKPLLDSPDRAVGIVWFHGIWMLYSDFRDYRRVGRDRLSSEQRQFVARCVLFLKTDLPYSWPHPPLRPLSCLVALLTLGLFSPAQRAFERSGDLDVWPFRYRADYEAALKLPVYLCGTK